MDYILTAIAGAAIVAVLWYRYAKKEERKHNALSAEKQTLRDEKADVKKENALLEAKIENLSDVEKTLIPKFAQLAQEAMNGQKATFYNDQKHYFDGKHNEFTNKLKDDISRFNTAIAGTHTQHGELKGQINQISKDANNLAHALKGSKGSSKQQGDWGETILESILEHSPLRKGEEYFIQKSLKDEQGNEKRPDAEVRLPENRCIFIDSKVSLTAYTQYIEDEDKKQPEAAKASLNQHVDSVRKHITGLSKQEYYTSSKGLSLNFTLMFMPIEPAFHAALRHESNLLKEASHKNIILVAPSTLMATLHIIHSLWQITKQNQNAKAIAAEAGKMYDKFCGFLVNFASIKTALKNVDSKLTGSGNLITKAKKIRELGAHTTKELPPAFKEETPDADPPAEDQLSLSPPPQPSADEDAPASPNANAPDTNPD